MLANCTTLADRNMRSAPSELCAKIADPSDAATNSSPVIVAEASPRRV